MKLKVFIIGLLVILAILVLVGCENEQKPSEVASTTPTVVEEIKEETKKEESNVLANNEVTINNTSFELDHENSHRNMYYKDNTTVLDQTGFDNVKSIWLGETDNAELMITLAYLENYPIDSILTYSGEFGMTKKIVNGIEYVYFEKDQIHSYNCEYSGDLYTISFKSDYDTTSVENAFMNNISFHE